MIANSEGYVFICFSLSINNIMEICMNTRSETKYVPQDISK